MIAEARVCDFCRARAAQRTSLAQSTCELCKLDYCEDDGAERMIELRAANYAQTRITISACNSCGGDYHATAGDSTRNLVELLPGLRDQIVIAWQALLAAQALTKK